MKIKKFGLIVFVIITFAMGCSLFSSEPDENTIQNGFVQCFGKSPNEWTVADFKVTNKFKKEIDKETVYIYEAQFKIKQISSGYTVPEGNQHISLACGLVKRGNSWYAMR